VAGRTHRNGVTVEGKRRHVGKLHQGFEFTFLVIEDGETSALRIAEAADHFVIRH